MLMVELLLLAHCRVLINYDYSNAVILTEAHFSGKENLPRVITQ